MVPPAPPAFSIVICWPRIFDMACSVMREIASVGPPLLYFVGGHLPAHQGKFVAYFRVSTDRQGRSGLGLDVQRKSVLDYLDGGRWSLVAEFTEVESGKHNDRPELLRALAACKK